MALPVASYNVLFVLITFTSVKRHLWDRTRILWWYESKKASLNVTRVQMFVLVRVSSHAGGSVSFLLHGLPTAFL